MADATRLERNLNVLPNLADLVGRAVTLLDEAKRNKVTIDLNALGRRLGIPVLIGCSARSGRGDQSVAGTILLAWRGRSKCGLLDCGSGSAKQRSCPEAEHTARSNRATVARGAGWPTASLSRMRAVQRLSRRFAEKQDESDNSLQSSLTTLLRVALAETVARSIHRAIVQKMRCRSARNSYITNIRTYVRHLMCNWMVGAAFGIIAENYAHIAM